MFTVVIARSKEGGLLNLPFPLGGWASDFDRREKKLMECKMGEAPHILDHYITLVDTIVWNWFLRSFPKVLFIACLQDFYFNFDTVVVWIECYVNILTKQKFIEIWILFQKMFQPIVFETFIIAALEIMTINWAVCFVQVLL